MNETTPTATANSTKPPESWDGKYFHVRFPHLTEQPQRQARPQAMLVGETAAEQQKADTYDWDTVFAIKFIDANRALRKPGATPTAFSVTDEGATAAGTFSAWQLSGGSGILLHMSVPIASGTTTYQNASYDMTGAIATIELQLADLPQPPNSNGTPHQVVPGADKPVSVTNLTNIPGNPGFIVTAVMSGLLEKWFTDNLSQFTHVFSTINLNEKADTAQFQWMKPTALGWAVSQKDTVDDSVFGILSMTDQRTAPNTMQVSPNAIPVGQVSGFLISQERFFEKLVLPGVHTLFDGSTEADFAVTNDGTTVYNVNTVYMDQVTLSGRDFKPALAPNHFRLTLEDNEIKMELQKAEVDFSPGITIMMDYTAFSSIVLSTNAKGEQVLLYQQASDPIIDHNVEVASWVTWTEVAASVAAALLTLGAGAWAKQAIERLVIRAVAIIVTLLVGELIANMAAIITAVAEGDKDKIPPIDLMVANATDPITWPDSGDFLITSAGLNESLQFGGNPNFTN